MITLKLVLYICNFYLSVQTFYIFLNIDSMPCLLSVLCRKYWQSQIFKITTTRTKEKKIYSLISSIALHVDCRSNDGECEKTNNKNTKCAHIGDARWCAYIYHLSDKITIYTKMPFIFIQIIECYFVFLLLFIIKREPFSITTKWLKHNKFIWCGKVYLYSTLIDYLMA